MTMFSASIVDAVPIAVAMMSAMPVVAATWWCTLTERDALKLKMSYRIWLACGTPHAESRYSITRPSVLL